MASSRKRAHADSDLSLAIPSAAGFSTEVRNKRQCVSFLKVEPNTEPAPTIDQREGNAFEVLTRQDLPDISVVHDLVNSPDYEIVVSTDQTSSGVVMFRIMKSTLELASAPFKNILEKHRPEQGTLWFNHDSWVPFYIFVRIIHFKIEDLPSEMDICQLLELARFCEKYQVSAIVSTYVVARKWMGVQLKSPELLDAEVRFTIGPTTQDAAYIAYVFKLNEDLDHLAGLLSKAVEVNEEDGSMFHVFDKTRVHLRQDLPTEITTKIRGLRVDALDKIRKVCKAALHHALHRPPLPRCLGRRYDSATRVGLLVETYHKLGLSLAFEDTTTMLKSVSTYIRSLMHMFAVIEEAVGCFKEDGFDLPFLL